MSIGSPDSALPRTDLPYLRRRVRARVAAPSSPAVVISFQRPPKLVPEPLAPTAFPEPGAFPAPVPLAPIAPPAAIPAVSAPPPTAVPVVPAVSASRASDLSLDLDLSSSTPTGSSSVVAPVAAREVAADAYVPVRTRPAAPLILTPKAPSMSLTRIQSGVGNLTIEAACGESVGDLRIGCAYRFRSGLSGVAQRMAGAAVAPPGTSRPIITARRSQHEGPGQPEGRGQYEGLSLDLRQSREIDRLIVYGYSESGGTLNWAGTLVVTTFGGSRVELPLTRPPSRGVAVLMSVYNVAGEFVLRAEMEQIDGSIRDACTAYGFDQVAWVDERTPLV